MQIETNKNIDTYKDDFFKGLTLQQTVAAVAVLISAGSSFAVFYILVGLPMSISIYCALPFALPFAVAGFLKIRGMSPYVYLQKKHKVAAQPVFVRKPAYVQITTEYSENEEAGNITISQKTVILGTEEELFLRSKAYEELAKRESGKETKKG